MTMRLQELFDVQVVLLLDNLRGGERYRMNARLPEISDDSGLVHTIREDELSAIVERGNDDGFLLLVA